MKMKPPSGPKKQTQFKPNFSAKIDDVTPAKAGVQSEKLDSRWSLSRTEFTPHGVYPALRCGDAGMRGGNDKYCFRNRY